MNNRLGTLVLALVLVMLTACAADTADAADAATAPAELTTEEQKTLYALGLMISRGLGPFALSEADLETVKIGLVDGVLAHEPRVDLEAYAAKVQELAQSRAMAMADVEKQASAEFLTKAAGETGAVKTDSGLIYIELTPGTGESPTAADTVRVHYHGTLRDGKVFDSSVDRGEPIEFPLSGVIPCWTEGVQRMKVGGKSRLVCPADIAYGDRGAPPAIKPGATLAFEVELIAIVK